jgi:hypothetical protein
MFVLALGLFLILSPSVDLFSADLDNPQEYIENCLKDSVNEFEDLIVESNGFPNREITDVIIYKGEQVPYACQVSEFYAICNTQDPIPVSRLTKETKTFTEQRLLECINRLEKHYQDKGYEVTIDEKQKLEILFLRNKGIINLEKSISLKKGEEVKTLKDFNIEVPSIIYSLFNLKKEIINSESTLCEFSEANWMLSDSSIIIKKFRASDQTKVYTLIDRITEDEIKFAVKTCVLPMGI